MREPEVVVPAAVQGGTLWAGWVVAHLVGGLLAAGASAVVGVDAGIIAAGLVAVVSLALAQALVLGRWVPHLAWEIWTLATIVGEIIAVLIAGAGLAIVALTAAFSSDAGTPAALNTANFLLYLGGAIVGLLAGGVLGLAQSFVLASVLHRARALLWPPVVAVAAAVALVLALIAPQVGPVPLDWPLGALAFGAITGGALVWLLRGPQLV